MGSVGDIVQLLEKIPVWKKLTALPERVAKLEARLDAIESKPADSHLESCPRCGEYEYKLIDSVPHKIFGEAGVNERTYKCGACSFIEKTTHKPQ